MTPATAKKLWLTTRKMLTAIIIVIATTMVYTGKMDAGTWVEAISVALVGHHASDVVKAVKGES